LLNPSILHKLLQQRIKDIRVHRPIAKDQPGGSSISGIGNDRWLDDSMTQSLGWFGWDGNGTAWGRLKASQLRPRGA
jgi:hypothetical protein